ncbi:N-6 DNA methylase [Brevibacillus ginsengisoli]|uniref:class I SAM-dependent DNA methyltransferase n=1 Tax=Brevibacillus ginsengisoli TaxID=363854 RepID=UPI003CEEB1E3
MSIHGFVQKLWNLCHILRDDGITYHQYVTELTYLLFIKLLKETGQEDNLPTRYRWDQLVAAEGEACLNLYTQLLYDLGQNERGFIQKIYANASTQIQEPRNLQKLIRAINELDWYHADVEGLGDLYEGLLAKNASEKKSGAGQYFTPRPLINVMVKLINPQPKERCHDPAAGTFGFMVACDRHVRALTNHYRDLTEEEVSFQQTEAFTGSELVPDTHRLALMNALLHNIKGDIRLEDSLAKADSSSPLYDVILTNPPFGAKKGGERSLRDDLPFPSNNKQLNFLQHIYLSLLPNGLSRAAVIVPDNVLFHEGDGQKIRTDLMEKCDLHTILRLPKGIFYAPGVHTSVLFFTRGCEDQGNTREVWYYDLRSEMPVYGKKLPLSEDCFTVFCDAYLASDRKAVQDPRWSSYSRQQIRDNHDNLDLGLIKEGVTHPPSFDPESLAEEALHKLEQATSHLHILLEELKRRGKGRSL